MVNHRHVAECFVAGIAVRGTSLFSFRSGKASNSDGLNCSYVIQSYFTIFGWLLTDYHNVAVVRDRNFSSVTTSHHVGLVEHYARIRGIRLIRAHSNTRMEMSVRKQYITEFEIPNAKIKKKRARTKKEDWQQRIEELEAEILLIEEVMKKEGWLWKDLVNE